MAWLTLTTMKMKTAYKGGWVNPLHPPPPLQLDQKIPLLEHTAPTLTWRLGQHGKEVQGLGQLVHIKHLLAAPATMTNMSKHTHFDILKQIHVLVSRIADPDPYPDPDSIGPVDPDSESGSGRAKILAAKQRASVSCSSWPGVGGEAAVGPGS